jgi:hypothetical protein
MMQVEFLSLAKRHCIQSLLMANGSSLPGFLAPRSDSKIEVLEQIPPNLPGQLISPWDEQTRLDLTLTEKYTPLVFSLAMRSWQSAASRSKPKSLVAYE